MREVSNESPCQDRAPTEERSGQQQIRERFVALALLIEHPGNGRKHHGDAELRRNSDRMQVVGGRPQYKYAAGGDLRPHPRLSIRVYLGCAEKKQRCRGQQPFVDGGLPGSDGRPRFEGRAEVVQSEQAPTGAPEHEVGLAPQAMHVGEETRSQCRRCQQCDRNDAFRRHQIERAARAARRTFHSIRVQYAALVGEKIKLFSRNLRSDSFGKNVCTDNRDSTPLPTNFRAFATIRDAFPDGQGYGGTSREQGTCEIGHMIFQLRIDLHRFSESRESTPASWTHFVQEHCVPPLLGLPYLRMQRFPTAGAVGNAHTKLGSPGGATHALPKKEMARHALFRGSPSCTGSANMKCFSFTGEAGKEHVHDFERSGKAGWGNSRAVCAVADGLFARRRRAHRAFQLVVCARPERDDGSAHRGHGRRTQSAGTG